MTDNQHLMQTGVLNGLRIWLERLESRDGYCGSFRRYHSNTSNPQRSEMSITVWQLGKSGAETTGLRSAFDGIGTFWHEFGQIGPTSGQKRDLRMLFRNCQGVASVTELESIRARADTNWPDLILLSVSLDEFVSDVSADSLTDLLNSFYHLLEAGGMIVVPLSSQSELAANVLLKFVEAREFDQCEVSGQCVFFRKEASIYCAPTIALANRSSIFDPGSCEESVVATFRNLVLPIGGQVLDVGVGDGRFSRHFLRETERLGGEYTGIEMTSKPENLPKFPEVARRTRFETNFFGLLEPNEYDLVILFFVFHSTKHWPLFLDQAKWLLKRGGRVMFANRDDRIIRWTHGRFYASESDESSAVREQTARYWEMRENCGVRTFDQTTTIIDRDRCTRAAIDLGFVPEQVVVVDRLRAYCLDRRQLCPGEDDPAMWNIGRVGVTRSDRRKLAGAFTVDSVEEILPENVFVSLLRKP